MSSGAVFCAGHLRDYRRHIDGFLTHLVEPNNLDVYLSVDRGSSFRERHIEGTNEPDPHDEEAFLKAKLGVHLKFLHWANEDPELEERRHLCQALFLQRGGKPETAWFLDQFVRLSHLVRLCHKATTARYDFLLRFRLDMAVEETLPVQAWLQQHSLQPGDVVIVPDWSHAVKEILMADHQTFSDIACLFPYCYGAYVPQQAFPSWDVPESQLGQFLRHHAYRLYQLRMEFGYRHQPEHNVCWVYSKPKPNFLQRDVLLLTHLPSCMSTEDVARVAQSPGVELHPVTSQLQPEVSQELSTLRELKQRWEGCQNAALNDPSSTYASVSVSSYWFTVILSVVSVILVVTNLWWWHHRQPSQEYHQSRKLSKAVTREREN